MPTLNLDRAPLGGATGSGAGGRAVLPRTLERFADQPWLRTAATGHHPEPAQRFRSTRFYNQQTFHGTAFEKFTEAKARVSETEQPDAAARIIAEGARAPSPHYRGIPPCVAFCFAHCTMLAPPTPSGCGLRLCLLHL